ncbi:preprotein translocase subunit YajC [Alicyclobacillus fastidiosus]|uniref:Preprotein translocase subunit YajC n=1 Tax=Alicyclobacillus fastidiosus TaxID=392011 RepID=A0ABV5ADH9_9BACL|nr:preprotein translocase subunit YajC [Alicyclobacillus fastidiosus]WEH11206.1 preprotein translocase subunit YajC [Alicyclobacillus fastidiosus]
MKGNSLIFLVILVVVFYFLLILPQRRNQKKKAEMMKGLAPGAKIMTASGIYAEVAEIHDDIIVARVAEGVEVEMDSRAVVRVVSEATAVPAQGEHPLGAPDEYEEDEFDDSEEAFSEEDGEEDEQEVDEHLHEESHERRH